jgi:hypothetical protein
MVEWERDNGLWGSCINTVDIAYFFTRKQLRIKNIPRFPEDFPVHFKKSIRFQKVEKEEQYRCRDGRDREVFCAGPVFTTVINNGNQKYGQRIIKKPGETANGPELVQRN